MNKHIKVISLILITSFSLSAQESNCDYFGLQKPAASPLDFNPGILDLEGSFKFNFALRNCDEMYFTTITSSESIFVSKKQNGQWGIPETASFSDPNYNDADPFITSDGSKLFFISKRPTHSTDKQLDFNIWYSERIDDDWTEPQPLPEPINSPNTDEYMFSVSDQGNAFFSSNRSGGNGSFDIYTTKMLDNNQFTPPVNAGRPLSTELYEFDPYISPDESFMIFSINKNGNSDLYYALKNKQGNWDQPKNFGDVINVTEQDFAPSLSPDGNYIFFSNNGKLRWVSSTILKN